MNREAIISTVLFFIAVGVFIWIASYPGESPEDTDYLLIKESAQHCKENRGLWNPDNEFCQLVPVSNLQEE